jgi:ribosomal protein L11 methyltransferase
MAAGGVSGALNTESHRVRIDMAHMTNWGQMIWRTARVRCEPGCEEAVGALLFASGFSGVQEDGEPDSSVLTAFCRCDDPDGDPVTRLRELLVGAAREAGTSPGTIETVEVVPDEDWEQTWRAGLEPIEIGRRLLVRPSWTTYDNHDDRIEIIIDPRMAFGTGGHETTRLCLELLDESPPTGATVLDAGCGSGILSIAAVKLGAARVQGFDHDDDSVANARDNIAENGVADRISISRADLASVRPDQADLVLANMISGVLLPTLGRFPAFMTPEGTVVFSGLLATEEDRFRGALAVEGFVVRDVLYMGEWIAVVAANG